MRTPLTKQHEKDRKSCVKGTERVGRSKTELVRGACLEDTAMQTTDMTHYSQTVRNPAPQGYLARAINITTRKEFHTISARFLQTHAVPFLKLTQKEALKIVMSLRL